MKIKRFNKETTPNRGITGAATIRFHHSGAITLNPASVDRLGIEMTRGGVEFIQDEERPKDWYMVYSNSEAAFKPRPGKHASGLIVQNAAIAKAVLKTLGNDATSAAMLIGAAPVEYEGEKLWPIITSSYKPKN